VNDWLPYLGFEIEQRCRGIGLSMKQLRKDSDGWFKS
jgi:hypothetical protein